MSDLLNQRSGEGYKGAIHLALFGLASICAAYNLGALYVRRERRLMVNVALYAGLAVLESRQIFHHWHER